MIFERRTNLGLGYRGAFSITQRREGQAEFQLSITLTKIEKEKGREDILKGIPHGSENNFLKVIWFHRLGLPRCSNTAVLAAFWKSLWREASLTSYFERLQHLLHSLRLFCSSRAVKIENGAPQHVSGLNGNPVALKPHGRSKVAAKAEETFAEGTLDAVHMAPQT